MSKKYIGKEFFIDRATFHDEVNVDIIKAGMDEKTVYKYKDYYLERQKEALGSEIVRLLADGQPYICELVTKISENERLDGYVVKMLFSYVPQAQLWIPCSERLPDVRHNVLITDGYHTAEGQLQDNGLWLQYRWTCSRKHDEIIAWQPLPEPYKADMRGEEQ